MKRKSAKYKAFIREQPCIICHDVAEPAHWQTKTNHGTGAKPDDTWCIPLCRHHHDELHRGKLTWCKKHWICDDVYEADVIAMRKIKELMEKYIWAIDKSWKV